MRPGKVIKQRCFVCGAYDIKAEMWEVESTPPFDIVNEDGDLFFICGGTDATNSPCYNRFKMALEKIKHGKVQGKGP